MSFATLEKKDGIAEIWLDQPGEKLNTLSLGLLENFDEILRELESDASLVGAVLISRKPDCFIAGADIREFAGMQKPGQAEEASRAANSLLSRVENFPKPIVAAINGAALGGGLEVALASHYRVATDHPKTVLGQPEVKLGLLPGAGGTQRLPRLVGLQRALGILLTGKNIYPHKARRIGLVDELIHQYGLLSAARAAVRDLAKKGTRRPGRRRTFLDRLLESPFLRWLVFRKARQQVLRQTRGLYPAPLRILECVRKGWSRGMVAGLKAESKAFGELMRSPESRQLVSLFFAITEKPTKHPEVRASEVKRIGVLGAGLMGCGVAQISSERGFVVNLMDLSEDSLSRARKVISDSLRTQVRKKVLSAFDRDLVLSRLHLASDYSGFDRVDLTIEAVFEDLELKRRILKEIESKTRDDAIFATNTSALPLSEISRDSMRPGQFVGMHYFSPVPRMPLLEIVRGNKTEDWVVSTCIEVGRKQGKTVIVVGDGPGFYTTRVLSPLMNESLLLLQEGAGIKEIDRAMRQFGFPVGPVALMDEVGLDVGAHVSETLGPLFAARGAQPSDLMHRLCDGGYLGRKNRRGFYRYPKDGRRRSRRKRKEVNEEIYSYFGGSRRKLFAEEEIQSRLSLIMVNEAALCLQEDILSSPRDGDVGAVLGLGFPPFLGGPFRYLDFLGPGEAVRHLEDLASRHGSRYTPASILVEAARGNRRFYE